MILITGACGHIGREVCRVLTDAKRSILPIDVEQDETAGVLACDLTSEGDIARLFQSYPIHTVIHLAGILPSAFQTDPLMGADVNLRGSCELMQQSAGRANRVIFASSMSVYGSSATSRALTEDDPAVPDEPYGASKRAIELIGEALRKKKAFEFVALRIARVVGPGIKKTSSPWRSEIFEASPRLEPISIPFSPKAVLSLVHVEDVARALVALVDTAEMSSPIYNTPVELWEAMQLKKIIEEAEGVRVELGPEMAHGGPTCDGRRFTREFGFQLRGLREHLSRSMPPGPDRARLLGNGTDVL
jgi:nucleoside-diphosphate-sugar epimerase